MKKLLYILSLFFGVSVVSCDGSDAPLNGYIETTQQDASTLVLKGYESAASGFSVCQPENFNSPFYLKDKSFYGEAYNFLKVGSVRLDEMTSLPGQDAEWVNTISVESNVSYWVRYASGLTYMFLKMRVVSIEGNNVTIEYVVSDETQERPNDNVNSNEGIIDNQSVTGYEIPKLNTDTEKYVYADHYVTINGNSVLNYALEWNSDMRHANWVAFSFDPTTSADVVKRTDAWAVDPKLPVEMQTQEADHKSDGFDKGHLCASEDRVYLKEANEQTFYYSNMSPQLNDLNGGLWAKLEGKVQTWGRSTITGTYDKVYVCKGGTMNELLVNFTGTPVSGGTPKTDSKGFTVNGLACPKYYFMAILSQKGNDFKAIGFLVEHMEGHPKQPTADQMKAYAVSIDSLEKKTGIDFFCNLPDLTEEAVEAEFNLNDWAW